MSDDLSIDNLKSDSADATILAAEQASVDAYADNVDALASESILTSAENGWGTTKGVRFTSDTGDSRLLEAATCPGER